MKFSQKPQATRIKRLDAVSPFVIFQLFAHGIYQSAVVARGFELDDERCFAVKQREHFAESGDMFVGTLQPIIVQLIGGEVFDVAFHMDTSGKGGVTALQKIIVTDNSTDYVSYLASVEEKVNSGYKNLYDKLMGTAASK